MQARWRGIKGREVAREEKDAVFVRLQSAEIEKRMEEERLKAMSAIEKLREYIELIGAGRYRERVADGVSREQHVDCGCNRCS